MSDILDGNAVPEVAVPPVVQAAQAPAPTPQVQPTAQPVAATQDQASLIGDSPLETSINIFAANTGVTADRFLASVEQAMKYDDVNLIDKTSLTQGLNPAQAAQAEALANAMYQNAQQERAAVKQTAHQMAGGEEQWNSAIQAFNTHAPKHIKAAVLAMEQSGAIKEAVEFIVSQVQSYGVVNSTQGNLVAPSGGAANTSAAMSAADFQKAVGALHLKAGNALHAPRSEHALELQQLQQRRELGKRQGI